MSVGYNPKKEIWFHEGRGWIVPTAELGGKVHTFQNTKGKMITLADLNIVQNNFYGGNYSRLIFIDEYGFYMCPLDDFDEGKRHNLVTGFYIHDPKQVTDKGKKLVTAFYKKLGKVIHFDYFVPPEVSEEEQEKADVKKHKEYDEELTPEIVTQHKAAELEALLRAKKVGQANIKVEVEPVNMSPAATTPPKHVNTVKRNGTAIPVVSR